jgi:hypothetical protein
MFAMFNPMGFIPEKGGRAGKITVAWEKMHGPIGYGISSGLHDGDFDIGKDPRFCLTGGMAMAAGSAVAGGSMFAAGAAAATTMVLAPVAVVGGGMVLAARAVAGSDSDE